MAINKWQRCNDKCLTVACKNAGAMLVSGGDGAMRDSDGGAIAAANVAAAVPQRNAAAMVQINK